MTKFLNFFTHIGSYFGPGIVMLIIGIIAITFAVVKLSRVRKAERSRAVAEFNQQFMLDTEANISSVDAASRRRNIAEELGIRSRY